MGFARASAAGDAQGFAIERLYQAAPGGGWVIMDSLDMRGGFGGVMAVTMGYARDPLRIRSSDGSQRLNLVSDQAFTDFGFAATYDRWRIYLNLAAPIAVSGEGGTVGAYSFVAPSLDLGSSPDTLSDARIGVDARILGDDKSPFRLGAGAQLFVPNGERPDYDTDGTYRAMLRVLFAGDMGMLTYAGQLGVHVRPLDDSPIPGNPQGSELLFGVAGGPKLLVGPGKTMAVIVGPELYGETALRAPFGATSTGIEGLLSGRVEGTRDHGAQWRVKAGIGGGLDAHFGAPEWRVLFGIEVFDHVHRDEG